jgi:tetratricopeptide (TPR) repeat protein/transcriptional regulator with XRE-family HTH domain
MAGDHREPRGLGLTSEGTVFGTRLSACRRSAGLTQQELAGRSGLSVRAVSNLELGRARLPHPDTVHRLADALGLHGDSRVGFLAAAGRRLGGGAAGPMPADQLAQAGGGLVQQDGLPLVAGRTQALAVVPRQLPAAVAQFTGRVTELAALNAVRDAARPGRPGAVAVAAIDGPPGVGKTALAVRWAQQAVAWFHDGQLYVNLRGSPDEIMPPGTAIRQFLDALGIPAGQIPPDPESQAGLYRSLLAGKRVLIVADNARDAGQVRPLLPGSPGCLVLVTSRNRLIGLAAAEGARLITLDVLPDREARELLARRIGVGRARAEPGAVEELAQLCGRLPLALAVAAARAAARPRMSLTAVAAELADAADRLRGLETGDPATDVRTVFSWSGQTLQDLPARMFRLLGIHPGPDITVPAAAALLAVKQDDAHAALGTLAMANLVDEHAPGRFTLHDLLRAYARELAAHDGEDGPRTALTRLLDHYLHTAAASMTTLFPAEASERPNICPDAESPMPAIDQPVAARAWLDAERANLVAAAAHAAAHGWPGHATRLAATLFRYLDAGSYFPEAVTMHSHARRAAAQAGDSAAEAQALIGLGVVSLRQGSYQRATIYLQQALRLCQQAGDRGGQARALVDLGLLDLQQGRYEQGRGRLRRAVAAYRDVGDRFAAARALANLGIIERRLGCYQQASDCFTQALALCQAAGDRLSQAPALTNLGLVDLDLGRHQQAADHHRQALALFREMGSRNGEAHALSNLGVAELRSGGHQQAAEHLRHALALFGETGDRGGEALALNGLGEMLLAAGQPGQARARHAAVLALTSQAGDTYEQARAHHGLARCHQASGDPAQALRHRQQALALYARLGAPEANQIRAELEAHDATHDQTARVGPDEPTWNG